MQSGARKLTAASPRGQPYMAGERVRVNKQIGENRNKVHTYVHVLAAYVTLQTYWLYLHSHLVFGTVKPG